MSEKQEKQIKLSLPQAKKMLPFDFKDLKLKGREVRFIAVYCMTFNESKAVKLAGYKTKSDNAACVQGNRLLKRANISEAVRRFLDVVIQPYRERLEYMIMDYWYCRAFYKIDYFYEYKEMRAIEEDIDDEEKGNIDYIPPGYELKPIHDIPEKWKVCIDGIEEKYYNQGKIKVTRYVLGDRSEALRNLWEFLQKSKGIEENPDDIKNIGKRMTAIFDAHFKDKNVLPFAK